jgi:hypothetical protein
MEVTIQVRPDVARALDKRGPPTAASRELLQAAAELGLTLVPLHPGVEVAPLSTYFHARVQDYAAAEQVIGRLLQCPAVEAAYVKPLDAMP